MIFAIKNHIYVIWYADTGYEPPTLFPSPAAKVDRTNSEWKGGRGPGICSGGASSSGRGKCKSQSVVS